METLTIEQEKKLARDEAYKDVKMYIANDWKLKEETPEFFLLTRNNGSIMAHILILFFFCWTFGVANLIYYFLKNEKKKILK
jgi:hypothetical protein